jgi:putative NADH-flavin reductase
MAEPYRLPLLNPSLGLAFVESYRAKGWDVIACVRDPRSMPQIDGVKVYKLDLGSLTDSKMASRSTVQCIP